MNNEKYEGTDKVIEVGDRVMYMGRIDEVIRIDEFNGCYNNYKLEGEGYVEYNELEYLTGTPHKHRDLIIAWANGAEIEAPSSMGWFTVSSPNWYPNEKYRIKPSKPSKQLEKERIQKEMEKLTKDLEALDV